MDFDQIKNKSGPAIQEAKSLGKRFVDYVKNNPRDAAFDIAAVVLTFMVMDIEDSLDSIDDSSAVSAAVDLENYWGASR
jgi:hypothetical protein